MVILADEQFGLGFVALYWAYSLRRELRQSSKTVLDDPLRDGNAVDLSNHVVSWPGANRVSVVTVDDYDYDGKVNVTHTALPLNINK